MPCLWLASLNYVALNTPVLALKSFPLRLGNLLHTRVARCYLTQDTGYGHASHT
jgi:hypothetical protein